MTTAATPVPQKEFLGHPVGLIYLVFAEAFERFSYYGMRSLLTIYLVQQLLLPGHVEHVLGFVPFHNLLTGIYGKLNTVGLASVIVSLYGFTYLTPMLGGFIADRWLGRTKTITVGAIIMVFGHFLMAFEQSFLFALLLILLGVGCFKGNISSQVGRLYGPEDERRGSAFQIFYLVFNTAVIIAPMICGTLGQKVAWHWGFGAAGVSMLLGLIVYLSGRKYLPPEDPKGSNAKTAKKALTGQDWQKIILLLSMIPFLGLALVMNEQIGVGYLIWGNNHLDLHLFGWEMPSTWLVSLDAFMSMITLAGAIVFWKWWSQKRREPDELTKIAFSGFLCALAPLALVGAAAFTPAGHKASLWWAILFEVFNDIGFANLVPVAMALFVRVAPQQVNGTMVGIFMLVFFLADFIVGPLGNLLPKIGPLNFWLMHFGIVAFAAVVLFLFWLIFGKKLIPESGPHIKQEAH
jgi:POT family proton-dependent oligopeptide transporter